MSQKNGKICFADKANANIFKELFCNLASDLVARLPKIEYAITIKIC